MNKYDVIIIGAGPSGIFCAYEFMRQKPDMKVLMIEKGRSIEKRQCPKRTTKVCVGCKPCSITTGFAGAGAFSDGKLSLSPDVGGTLLFRRKNSHSLPLLSSVLNSIEYLPKNSFPLPYPSISHFVLYHIPFPTSIPLPLNTSSYFIIKPKYRKRNT